MGENTKEKVFDTFRELFHLKSKEYNRIAYDENYIKKEFYNEEMVTELSTLLSDNLLESAYIEQKTAFVEEVTEFVNYVMGEMKSHTKLAAEYACKVKETLDRTREYENNIEALERKQRVLENINEGVEEFLTQWRETIRELPEDVEAQ